MINFYCDKCYHQFYDVKNVDLPKSVEQKLNLEQVLALLSILYIKYANKYRVSSENRSESLVTYLFHPESFNFDISLIPKYADTATIMNIFKMDKRLSEFTNYYVSDKYLDVRTILLFPIYLESEKNITHLVIFDVLSNFIFIFSPFNTVRLTVFSLSLENEFLTELEVPLNKIYFICKCYFRYRSQRVLYETTDLELQNISQDINNAWVSQMAENLRIKYCLLTKENLDNHNLDTRKFVLVLHVLKRFLRGIGILGWKTFSVETGNFGELLNNQQSLTNYLTESVFNHNVKRGKFPKASIFGFTPVDLLTEMTMLNSLYDDYRNRRLNLDFDLLNFHYMHPDKESETILWNILQKHEHFKTRSSCNSVFVNGKSKSLNKLIGRWIEADSVRNGHSIRSAMYENILPLLRELQLQKFQSNMQTLTTASIEDSEDELEEVIAEQEEVEEEEDINIQNMIDPFVSLTEENQNDTYMTDDTIFDAAINFESKVPNSNSSMEGKQEERVDNVSALDFLFAAAEQYYSNLIASLGETNDGAELLDILRNHEANIIQKDYNLRVLKYSGRAPSSYLCSFEYVLLNHEKFDFKKVKRNYLNNFHNIDDADLIRWIDSRVKSLKDFWEGEPIFQRNGDLFEISKSRYFIPIHSIVMLMFKIVVLVDDLAKFSEKKYWFIVKNVVQVWLFQLPENRKDWTPEHRAISKNNKITNKLVANISWFGEFYSLFERPKDNAVTIDTPCKDNGDAHATERDDNVTVDVDTASSTGNFITDSDT